MGVWARLRTLGGREVDDVAVGLEHVDLLNGLDGLHVQLLESSLELLVIVGAAGDVALLLVSRGALATYSKCQRLTHVRLPRLCLPRNAIPGRNGSDNIKHTSSRRRSTAELLLEDLLHVRHLDLMSCGRKREIARGSSEALGSEENMLAGVSVV